MKKNVRVIILTMASILLCLLCACSKEKENRNETTTNFNMKAAQSRDRRCLDEVRNMVRCCITDAETKEIAITEGDILLTCTDIINDDLTIKGSTGLEIFLEQERIPKSTAISKADPSKTTIKVSIRGNTKEWKVDASYE